MQFDITYSKAIALAEHLIAVGDTTIYLHTDEGFPFDKVSAIEEGNTWRLGMPASAYMIAKEAGLTFRLSVEFESRGANGSGTSQIDRDRLRSLMLKLPELARARFAELLETKCIPAMSKSTRELRDALQQQADSEDCIRGLIAFAREPA